MQTPMQVRSNTTDNCKGADKWLPSKSKFKKVLMA